jgi:hypothetical protein
VIPPPIRGGRHRQQPRHSRRGCHAEPRSWARLARPDHVTPHRLSRAARHGLSGFEAPSWPTSVGYAGIPDDVIRPDPVSHRSAVGRMKEPGLSGGVLIGIVTETRRSMDDPVQNVNCPPGRRCWSTPTAWSRTAVRTSTPGSFERLPHSPALILCCPSKPSLTASSQSRARRPDDSSCASAEPVPGTMGLSDRIVTAAISVRAGTTRFCRGVGPSV